MNGPASLRDPLPIFVGIDLGGTSIHAAAVRGGQILAEVGAKTRHRAPPGEIIGQIADLVTTLVDGLEEGQELAAVCVGAPGAVDGDTGLVRSAPNLGWANVALGPELSGRIGLPVFVDNDVNVGAVGEHARGAGKGCDLMAAIFVGTGVGGALMVAGRPFRGGRGAAGEFGHMVAVPDGRRCGCGRLGCFEAYTSKTAMEAIVRERMAGGRSSLVPEIMQAKGKTRISSSVIEAALDQGDELMTEVLAEAQLHLSRLVANLVNAFDPEAVILGGGVVARLGERFVGPIAREARAGFLQQAGAGGIRIVPGALGDSAGTVGAAVVAERRLGARAG